MKTFVSHLCFLASIAWLSAPARAQIRVGPFGGVSVRVPFVSVDVLPFGAGTSVRAPLTRVDTGLYGGFGYRPYPVYSADIYAARRPIYGLNHYHSFDGGYPDHLTYLPHQDLGIPPHGLPFSSFEAYPLGTVPIEPSLSLGPAGPLDGTIPGASTWEPPPGNLRAFDSMYATPDALIQAAQTLQRSLLSRGNDAEVWMSYLKPDQVIDTVRTRSNANQLVVLLRNYDGVSTNSDLTGIANLPGFRRTHQGLRVWINRNADHWNADPSVMNSDPTSSHLTVPNPVILDKIGSGIDLGASLLSDSDAGAAASSPVNTSGESGKPSASSNTTEPTPAPLPAPAAKNSPIPEPVPDAASNEI